jgi:hypothetical protein
MSKPLGMTRTRSMALRQILLIVVLAALASGCTVAAGIFKAGFWVGIIVAVVIVVGLMMLLRKRG